MDLLYYNWLNLFKNVPFGEFIAVCGWYIFNFVLIAIFLLIAVIILVLAERKVLAFFTLRKGPNRVGFWGCLQTVADAVKLLFKEDIVPDNADKFVFWLAPIIVFAPAMCVFALVPYHSRFHIINSQVGILLFSAFLTLPVLGVMLAGWASNNKYSLLGAMRACAQTISYEIPLILSALSVTVLAGSLNLNSIVQAQSATAGIFGWFFIPAVLGFFLFFICAIAEMNRVPFDLSEAESELVSGYNTEYSGMKFAMFFLAEYAIMFVMCMFIATLFLGGYLSPLGFYVVEKLNFSYITTSILVYFEQFFWLMAKTTMLIVAIMWIRATLPRLRYDQLLKFAWKFLLPLSIVNFFAVSVIKYYRL